MSTHIRVPYGALQLSSLSVEDWQRFFDNGFVVSIGTRAGFDVLVGPEGTYCPCGDETTPDIEEATSDFKPGLARLARRYASAIVGSVNEAEDYWKEQNSGNK